eukprot:scaffold4.g4857.t1
MQGYQVDVASVKGGEIPFDPASKEGDLATPQARAFLQDKAAREAVRSSLPLAEVHADAYDAVFLPGGHGVMWDLPGNEALRRLLEEMWAAGKVVSAVCHGPAGLVDARDAGGEPLVKGRAVTGFSNAEEEEVKKAKIVPFLLEARAAGAPAGGACDKLKELGADYSAARPWAPYALASGRLVTGQNPASSRRAGARRTRSPAVNIRIVLNVRMRMWRAGARARKSAAQPPARSKAEGEGFKHRGHDVTRAHHDHQAGGACNKRAPCAPCNKTQDMK